MSSIFSKRLSTSTVGSKSTTDSKSPKSPRSPRDGGPTEFPTPKPRPTFLQRMSGFLPSIPAFMKTARRPRSAPELRRHSNLQPTSPTEARPLLTYHPGSTTLPVLSSTAVVRSDGYYYFPEYKPNQSPSRFSGLCPTLEKLTHSRPSSKGSSEVHHDHASGPNSMPSDLDLRVLEEYARSSNPPIPRLTPVKEGSTPPDIYTSAFPNGHHSPNPPRTLRYNPTTRTLTNRPRSRGKPTPSPPSSPNATPRPPLHHIHGLPHASQHPYIHHRDVPYYHEAPRPRPQRPATANPTPGWSDTVYYTPYHAIPPPPPRPTSPVIRNVLGGHHRPHVAFAEPVNLLTATFDSRGNMVQESDSSTTTSSASTTRVGGLRPEMRGGGAAEGFQWPTGKIPTMRGGGGRGDVRIPGGLWFLAGGRGRPGTVDGWRAQKGRPKGRGAPWLFFGGMEGRKGKRGKGGTMAESRQLVVEDVPPPMKAGGDTAGAGEVVDEVALGLTYVRPEETPAPGPTNGDAGQAPPPPKSLAAGPAVDNAAAKASPPGSNAPANPSRPRSNAALNASPARSNASANTSPPKSNAAANPSPPRSTVAANPSPPRSNAGGAANASPPRSNAPANATPPRSNAPGNASPPRSNVSGTGGNNAAPTASPAISNAAPNPSPPRSNAAPAPSPPRSNTPANASPPGRNAAANPSPPRSNAAGANPSPPRSNVAGAANPSPPRSNAAGAANPSPPRSQASATARSPAAPAEPTSPPAPNPAADDAQRAASNANSVTPSESISNVASRPHGSAVGTSNASNASARSRVSAVVDTRAQVGGPASAAGARSVAGSVASQGGAAKTGNAETSGDGGKAGSATAQSRVSNEGGAVPLKDRSPG
ncbi:uncharacterized protein BDZ99DRAFT_573867 [Mytilinidion resinicola]|uniref:Uncharacterized protein n=1 Tax=Mytilinidion resinicola TaxID=574789 RepID=A0A6A6YBU7_9PEZI|nr:uncharacterized protein BDZ99DRAFT_573867 [Mytilinidion resinicola]KAF2806296.1 hypothetical protein BDZ99DRAFT_573867 [Mytilinidion resinicola]